MPEKYSRCQSDLEMVNTQYGTSVIECQSVGTNGGQTWIIYPYLVNTQYCLRSLLTFNVQNMQHGTCVAVS